MRLANVAQLEPAQGPTAIDRYGRQRQVVVLANLKGIALGEAVQDIGDYVRSLDLPPDYRHEFLGRAKTDGRVEYQLSDRVRAELPVHVHDPGGPVRELRSPDHDPARAAADDAVRVPVAVPVADRRWTSTPCSACSCCSAS